MKSSNLFQKLNENHKEILCTVYKNATVQLDNSCRFKFFTLHGTAHINSLFRIADILLAGGIELSEVHCYWLSLSICLHDIGMITHLQNEDIQGVLGVPQAVDPAIIEDKIREFHHLLVDKYFNNNFTFFIGLGMSTSDLKNVSEICSLHRKKNLLHSHRHGPLGALLRFIDEIDISNERAPIEVLHNSYKEMDGTSCWHWYKHNIVEPWVSSNNVNIINCDGQKKIVFKISISPTSEKSKPYWMHQIYRPINRVLFDDQCHSIIIKNWGVDIRVEKDFDASKICEFTIMKDIENKALTGNRKIILIIDDEIRKLEDLFFPLMEDYHVIYSNSAKDAFDKMNAAPADLAIVDLEIGSGGIWTSDDTGDFKKTGKKIAEDIIEKYPSTKVGILTGSKYNIEDIQTMERLSFLERKPIEPDKLKGIINALIQ